MAAPGFSAQASLYNSIHYYATVLAHGVDFSNSAVPSLPIRNGGGNGGCHVDCTPCDASCRKTCTNSCTGRSVTSSCCSSGFSCQNGTCVCPAPKTVCGSVCTNLASDPSNCGGCGHTCPAGSTCQQGTCFPTPPVCTCNMALRRVAPWFHPTNANAVSDRAHRDAIPLCNLIHGVGNLRRTWCSAIAPLARCAGPNALADYAAWIGIVSPPRLPARPQLVAALERAERTNASLLEALHNAAIPTGCTGGSLGSRFVAMEPSPRGVMDPVGESPPQTAKSSTKRE